MDFEHGTWEGVGDHYCNGEFTIVIEVKWRNLFPSIVMCGIITIGIETVEYYSNETEIGETQMLYQAGYGVMCDITNAHSMLAHQCSLVQTPSTLRLCYTVTQQTASQTNGAPPMSAQQVQAAPNTDESLYVIDNLAALGIER